ncbi:MAG: helix-turn-helix domain-containing protein [Colwellia sp.]|nr:helix-turn-helix domain-containing protein [Colwellia sp.]
MTLGEQLKKLRQERELSQPELSALVGIEQSYLSKLENDKSIPSNEIFQKILTAFNLNLEQFLKMFTLSESKKQLIQIPMIDAWFKQQHQVSVINQRQYLYVCSFLIVIAITLFYTGASKLIFTERFYQYESRGIVLKGEPKNIFHQWRDLLDRTQKDSHKVSIIKGIEMAKRRDDVIYLSPNHRGQRFSLEVEGGLREYYIDREVEIPQPINAWLQLFGVLLMSAGIMGFVLERKFYKL